MLRAESGKALIRSIFFKFFYANRLTFPTKPPRTFYSELFNMKQLSIEQLLIEQSLFKQFYKEQMGTGQQRERRKKAACVVKKENWPPTADAGQYDVTEPDGQLP